jgi:hypothetical protein
VGCEVVFEQQYGWLGVVQNRGELGGLQPDVERHSDRSYQWRAVITLEELIIVEAQKRYAVALPHTLRLKAGCKALASLAELFVGIALRPGHHPNLAGI